MLGMTGNAGLIKLSGWSPEYEIDLEGVGIALSKPVMMEYKVWVVGDWSS